RGRLDTGTLAKLIEEKNVVGVTTNSSIYRTVRPRAGARKRPRHCKRLPCSGSCRPGRRLLLF
ncbi:hypothetical protein, partial [Pseudarthrobacter sp. NKDBFgelt]|uniref:hypothetical protein n=1 Tax=Pseudarthrobacter sp. NKDBFgelt TaxID=3384443 RepID=UPI0038D4CEC8